MSGPVVEALFDTYVERFRVLLAPQTWQRLGMDLSRNDFFILLLLSRRGEARMSDVAAYLDVALNTATGVVARLQRQGLVERRNSAEDKRVVVVSLSEQGREFFAQAMRQGLSLGSRVLDGLNADQVTLLVGVADRVLEVLAENQAGSARRRPVRRIVIE